MKHAYLIIAHNEFIFLQKLIDFIDDERIDIYILFDKKVKNLPSLTVKHSNITILTNRVNIYWGHYSQIIAELELFKAVSNKSYQYCHLISGVHFPLVSQEQMFLYFDSIYPKQLFSPLPCNPFEVDMKVKLQSFFIKYYRNENKIVSQLAQYAWVALLKIQRLFNLSRNRYSVYIKCSNWVSITQEAVDYIVSKEKEILFNFKYTFCGDEFFVPTILKNSTLDFDFLYDEKLLYQKIENTRAIVFGYESYDELIDSQALFARKFTDDSIHIADRIADNYNNR